MPRNNVRDESDISCRIPSSSHRRLRLVCGTVLALLTVTVLALDLAAWSPAVCRACHRETLGDGSNTPGHESIGCMECHQGYRSLVKLVGAGHIVEGALTPGASAYSAVGSVEDEACVSCHPVEKLLEVVESRGVRMSHRGLPEGGYVCVDCHEALVHDTPDGKLPVPTMGMCTTCHDGASAASSCDTCHPERAADDGDRLHDAEWAQTHGAEWEKGHGLGDLSTCGVCHKPEKCTSCHGVPLPHPADFGVLHGHQAIELGQAMCRTCHTDAFCSSCHGIEMPHPTGFLQQHSAVAKNRTDGRCLACHTSANCNECHERHTHPGARHRMRPPTEMYENLR